MNLLLDRPKENGLTVAQLKEVFVAGHNYFFPALEVFNNQRVKFLVFSGGSRKGGKHNQSDMEWCKLNLKGNNFVFCEGNTDLEDFAIMTNCDHNVVSHSTSFGYWASILNKNPDKIIIAPENYTIPDDGRAMRGFYPDSWIKL